MLNERVFKAYDIRGIYPTELDEEGIKAIAGAYAAYVKPKTVAVGRDVRPSSPDLQKAVIEGLTQVGVNVIDIGLVPSELLYFAVGSLDLDGGIQVTASHNTAEWNGLYLVKKDVEMCSGDSGLPEIKALALANQQPMAVTVGQVEKRDLEPSYLEFLAKQAEISNFKKLKIVANNNFGLTGPIARKLLANLKVPAEIVELNFKPDGSFPKGQPNPLLLENRAETSEAIKKSRADLGVAWDADGDRCYIADENGEFIEGCHLTAILAEYLLKKVPGQKVVYDPRNVWAVEETVSNAGGVPLMNKAGHTFIKNRMKAENALFAGEMSGHFYFRDFYDADNGILPFIYFLNIIAATGKKASQIAQPFREKYFVSGEHNFKVADINQAIATIQEKYPQGQLDQTDGLSLRFDTWRFNLRGSNTEPLLRLNVEAKDAATVSTKLAELTALIQPLTTP
ncbi:MAG TPA: phosphomannomutase/phosphoglucomutase [Candidatus Saccharimonadales bacterium]|nr:phosphomannomutase/phosphoglucomutase [Candidatus Saccharimonadales bacterium]